jgi:uncharacterized membrane protein
MGTYRHTATVDLPADELFAFLRKPENLPRYFTAMTEAKRTGEEEVHVEADVHGHHVSGEAWLRIDDSGRKLEWGAENEDDYHGELEITEHDKVTSGISIVLHTEHAEGDEVQKGLEETVAALAHTAVADADVAAAEEQGGWTA